MKELIKENNWNKVFSIARQYKFEFTKDEKRLIDIASDCKDIKKQLFYKSLGIDYREVTEKAKQILRTKYNSENNQTTMP